MITEEEAKTKWCPLQGRLGLPDDRGCIGSACMAWREETTTTARHKPGYGPVIETAATGGYCGLAGKP